MKGSERVKARKERARERSCACVMAWSEDCVGWLVGVLRHASERITSLLARRSGLVDESVEEDDDAMETDGAMMKCDVVERQVSDCALRPMTMKMRK
jgi:hypothetical protein